MKRFLFLTMLFCTPVLGGVGAHGPGGEHLGTPSQGQAGGAAPRIEAASESLELVGRLLADELSLLIDRYETNEPVLDAQVEVRFGALKASAKYHADHGDYSVDDAEFLKALRKPGEHALIITVLFGTETDLFEGKLVVTSDAAAAHAHWPEYLLILAAALAVLGAIFYAWRRRFSRRVPALILAGALALPSGSDAGVGAHGPGGQHLDASPGASATGPSRLPDGSVSVPKSAQRRLEIRTQVGRVIEAAATLELPARVVADPNSGGRVQPMHGGRVEPAQGALPVAGQKVAKGQTLAYVRHHAEPFAAANQQAQLAELRAGRAVAEQKVARLESLEGTVPRKEIDAARVELRSLTEREHSVAASIGSREPLVAPVSGVVSVAGAISGQVVEARDILFEIVDPSRLLVEAVLADVGVADSIAGAQVRGLPGVTLALAGVGRSLRDGVLPVTFRAASAAPLPLAVGQPVTVIATLKERLRGIVLPARALARNPANEPVVWIKAGAERFVALPVRTRALDAERIVVTSGLEPDNRVVVDGAGLLSQIR
jgi:hypothetical protein